MITEYFNRHQRRKLYKKHKKKIMQTWEEFNGEFIKKEPYRKAIKDDN